jgi:DNA-binding transcriptional regulator YiaG
MLRAKRTIEAALDEGCVRVEVPRVPDAHAFENELRSYGFDSAVRSRKNPDVAALRQRLGLTQEQFANRFGLDVDAVRNWEHGRRAPDTAARALLKVISRYPDLVAEAQDG